jgi:hypothetical protein
MRNYVLTLALAILSASCAHAQTFAAPDVLRYGATVAETQAALAGRCTSMVTRPINPPFAPNVQRQQLQIDCDGFEFFGAPRWAEFVFRDDSLEMAWIMVRSEDQPAIVAAMEAAYGAPTLTNSNYIAFAGANAAWRHRPAEVLFYSPAFETWAEDWIDD